MSLLGSAWTALGMLLSVGRLFPILLRRPRFLRQKKHMILVECGQGFGPLLGVLGRRRQIETDQIPITDPASRVDRLEFIRPLLNPITVIAGLHLHIERTIIIEGF